MISHTSSNSSSIGNCKSVFNEKDYDLIHYFDNQSDNEIEPENNQIKIIQNKLSTFKENDYDILYSSSDDLSKDENFFKCDEDSISDSNEKVIEKSPDGNYGKVINYIYLI
jgi:hypothetical protein